VSQRRLLVRHLWQSPLRVRHGGAGDQF
jgi:hypothetical protein